ncbi:hypothetical protein EXIGLDRAFT_783831 [Exidia glandulosa HHB12029]|uniref:Uncharacterized protein n=1 Tax=Exidia glandulosa HHB12029 TaxID=1314781 RepID=A0A165Z116_EXIGL|nr:hypothetical protein EXIGLDRAFT_783831 [Exidia glandulosa HHB12029]
MTSSTANLLSPSSSSSPTNARMRWACFGRAPKLCDVKHFLEYAQALPDPVRAPRHGAGVDCMDAPHVPFPLACILSNCSQGSTHHRLDQLIYTMCRVRVSAPSRPADLCVDWLVSIHSDCFRKLMRLIVRKRRLIHVYALSRLARSPTRPRPRVNVELEFLVRNRLDQLIYPRTRSLITRIFQNSSSDRLPRANFSREDYLKLK